VRAKTYPYNFSTGLRENHAPLPISGATLRRSPSYTEKRDGSKAGGHPEKRG